MALTQLQKAQNKAANAVRDCVYCHDLSIRMDAALARIGGEA